MVQIPQEMKAELVKSFRISYWRQGEQLVAQDALSDAFYVVAEGVLGVQVNGTQVHRIGAWGTFGEMALVDSAYTARATIVSESKVMRMLVLRREAFVKVMESFADDDSDLGSLRSSPRSLASPQ